VPPERTLAATLKRARMPRGGTSGGHWVPMAPVLMCMTRTEMQRVRVSVCRSGGRVPERRAGAGGCGGVRAGQA